MEKHQAPIIVFAEIDHYPCETCGTNSSEEIAISKLCENGLEQEIVRAWRSDHFGNVHPDTISFVDFDDPAIVARHLLAPFGIAVDAGRKHFVLKRGDQSARFLAVDGSPILNGSPVYDVVGLADLIAAALPHFDYCTIRRFPPRKSETKSSARMKKAS